MTLSTTSFSEPDTDDQLDLIFRALSHRTRRRIMETLSQSPALVTELAEPFDMALPTISKHIRVLEEAGLVVRSVDGRVHRCSFGPAPLKFLESWLSRYRPFWECSLESLARYAEGSESGDS